MPKVDKEHKQSRKKQILQAAVECFGNQGFHKTSMRDICEKADLSTGAVYNYFDGKYDIIETMAKGNRNFVELLFQDIKETDSRNQAIKKILHNLTETIVTQKKSNQWKMNIHFWSEALGSERIKSIIEESYRYLTSKVLSQLKNHEPNEINADLTNKQIATLLLSVYHGLVVHLALIEDINPEEYFDPLLMVLTNQGQ